jgi:hypothetical protein
MRLQHALVADVLMRARELDDIAGAVEELGQEPGEMGADRAQVQGIEPRRAGSAVAEALR